MRRVDLKAVFGRLLPPAVILLAVDVSVSPVQGGVRLQLAVTQAAAQAHAVPHPSCSQQEEAIAHLLRTTGAHHGVLDGHGERRLRDHHRLIM